LQYFVGCGDRACVHLKAALGSDEPCEFEGDVDVGRFERPVLVDPQPPASAVPRSGRPELLLSPK
jgi:hypothetical protein